MCYLLCIIFDEFYYKKNNGYLSIRTIVLVQLILSYMVSGEKEEEDVTESKKILLDAGLISLYVRLVLIINYYYVIDDLNSPLFRLFIAIPAEQQEALPLRQPLPQPQVARRASHRRASSSC